MRMPEIFQICDVSIARLFQESPGCGSLNCQRGQLVGDVFDCHVEAERVLMEPSHVRIGRCPPIEVFAQARDRAIVDHFSLLVAPAAVDHLADGHFADVARDHAVHKLCRVFSADSIFIEWRNINHRGGVPYRVVFVLVVRLIHAYRVVPRPFAVAQTLAQLKGLLVNSSSDRHSRSSVSTKSRCIGREYRAPIAPWQDGQRACCCEVARRFVECSGSRSVPTNRARVAEIVVMANQYDIIVIGGGHKGLVNAAYLALAGKKVLVLERRHLLGGAAVTEEIIPGFKFSVFSYVVSLLRPEIIRDLDLPRHGLEILPLDGTMTPMTNGDYLWRVNDHAKTRRELERHSKLDAEAYEEFGKSMVAMCRFVKPILGMIPPDPTSLDPRDLKKLAFLGKRFQSLAAEDKYNLVQLMTMSAADFLEQWFETDVLKATMSASGIIGTFLGIRSPGTAYVLLPHYMGEIDGAFRSWGFSRGGTGTISNAIGSAAREAGVEIRLEAPVSRILIKSGSAQGVVLETGEEIRAAAVSSSVAPNLTFLKFIEPRQLPGDFLEAVRRYKYRGSSGKVNLALDALPNFTCLPGPGRHLRGAISISPSMDYMERAYDQAKYVQSSRRPYIDMVIPTLTDPSVAPPGEDILSCFVH